METFRTLREGSSDDYERGINSYLKSVKEKGVKILGARYLYDGDICAVIDMKPYVRDKVEIEFGGHSEFFNVWYYELSNIRMKADDFVTDWNGLQKVKNEVRKYVEENNIPSYKSADSDNHDHSWLLNNNGWM